MAKTFRDKDKWKVRQLLKEKSELFQYPCTHKEAREVEQSQASRVAKAQIEQITEKYGGGLRPNAGRKGSTRRTLAILRRTTRRIEKRGDRQQASQEIKELIVKGGDEPTVSFATLDLELIIHQVSRSTPSVKWEQLSVTHPKDDDGLWFFWVPGSPGEVQIESSSGMCPFLVETDKHDGRFEGRTPEEVANVVIEWLGLSGGHQI